MKKLLGVMAAYIICAFALCVGVSAVLKHLPMLLPGTETVYRFTRGVLFFLDIFPALVASGFLVACSISFGRNSGKCPSKFSPVMFGHYKVVMICSICLVFLLTFSREILSPYFGKKQQRAKEAPYLLAEYIKLGKQNFNDGNMILAHEYGRHAVALSPKNEEAKYIVEQTEAVINAIKPVQKKSSEKKSSEKKSSDINKVPETITSLINKSKKAASEENWFDAHYYSQLAIAAGTGQDINLDDARLCASEAWNHLSSPVFETDTPSELFFKRKRDAYVHLIQGDILEAYYLFLSISEESRTASVDPDVVRYLEISKEKLSSQYFFIDETVNMQKFESSTNIYFRLKMPDNSVNVFYIHGITPVVRSGNMVQYLRGLSVFTYDSTGKKIKSFEVPYAKMLVQSVDLFGKETQQRLGLEKNFKNIPYIMLESVDRLKGTDGTNGDGVIRPVYEYADTNSHQEKGFMILPMPFNDFEMICEASVGADKMNFLSLSKFVKSARSYGYAAETFNNFLIRRLIYPILILILLIFLASFAWNYRIGEKQIFKFKWIFVLPISTVVLYITLKALASVVNVINYVLVASSGPFALILSLAICLVMLILVSIIFLGRTSD